jgi:hypothetical protein
MTETAGFRVVAADGDTAAAPRLVVSCVGCGREETMNDEEGGCGLGDLTAWASAHRCHRPLSYISVGDLVTPVDETVIPQRLQRRSSLQGGTLRPGLVAARIIREEDDLAT